MNNKPKFFQCGCCDHYHRTDFWGDCRQDNERFFISQLDEKFGSDGWEEISQEQANA